MNREELIADARRDISDAERCQALHVTPATGTILRRLREVTNALAVFEKAHVPTDDEREALARLVDPGAFVSLDPAVVDPRWLAEVEHRQQEARHHAERIAAAGFRRSEVPEPQGDDRTHEFANMAAIMGIPEPQGEPSDAQVDTIATAIAVAANADYWTDEIAEWEGAEAWYREAYPNERPHMAYEDREQFRKQARAALRAAGGVR